MEIKLRVRTFPVEIAIYVIEVGRTGLVVKCSFLQRVRVPRVFPKSLRLLGSKNGRVVNGFSQSYISTLVA